MNKGVPGVNLTPNNNPNLIFSRNTARTIFEDLVCLGSDPTEIMAIMKACGFTLKQERELVANTKGILDKMRKNRVANRIFRSKGWNAMDSGWSGIF